MPRVCLPLLVAACLSAPGLALAQFEEEASGKGVRYGDVQTQKYRAGVIVQAVGGTCRGLKATIPMPFDWPEQEVRILDEDVTPHVKKIGYRDVEGGGAKQMLIDIPLLAGGHEARALVTFEVRRRHILPPEDTSIYVEPGGRIPRELRHYLGPSPYIESRHPAIQKLAREVLSTRPDAGAWERVEAFYDHVREVVKYKDGPLKGALQALRDGEGDCEELSSLFIALCRASDIPARTVWVPGHCYPEFYLLDDEGQGHWFPCQAAGTRAFGEMPENRPILQKGDNFRVPEKPKERQRYVAEFLRGVPVPGGGQPKVQFVREPVD